MQSRQVGGLTRLRRRPGAALALLAAALAVLTVATAPAFGAAASRQNQLQDQLNQTLARLHGTQVRLSDLSAQTAQAMGELDQVQATLAADARVAVMREAEAAAAAAAVARTRVVLAHLEAVARARRLEVRGVLQGEEVASADPLGGLAPLLDGGSLSQAVSVQTEIALVGRASAHRLEVAGRAVLAARREAHRLSLALAVARVMARRAAGARAATARAVAQESQLVATLTRDKAATASAVSSLEAHAAGLREAIAVLLAAARSGSVSNGTLLALVAAVAGAYHVDPSLVWAVVMVESGGNPNATSVTGAEGLMQLEPGTAAALGVPDAYDAKDNLQGGTAYLSELIRRYHGNLALALAAYNLGPGAVPIDGPVPAAARAYVDSVLSNEAVAPGRFGGG